MASIELRHVTLQYEGVKALDDIDCSFIGPGLYVVRGENGAGKSTLLSLLSGQKSDYQGEILVDGFRLDASNREGYAIEDVSYLTQNSIVFEDLDVLENVMLSGMAKDAKKAKKILDVLSLGNLEQQEASTLSVGEKQRLAFARLLYDAHPIILLDEVTSALDKENAEIVEKIIRDLAKDHLVIAVTHEDGLKEAKEIRIHAGRIEKTCPALNAKEGKASSWNGRKSIFVFLKRLFRKDRWAFIASSFFCFLFSFLAILSDSFSATFRTEGTDSFTPVQEKAFEIYREDSPIFVTNQDVSFFSNRAEQGTAFAFNPSNVLFLKGPEQCQITGIAYAKEFSDFSKLGIRLADVGDSRNRLPENLHEALISDVCFETLIDQWVIEKNLTKEEAIGSFFAEPVQLVQVGDTFLTTPRVVGVYESFGSVPSKEFLLNKDGKVSYPAFRSSYLFGVETLFCLEPGNQNYCMLLNSPTNRKLLKIDELAYGILETWNRDSNYFSPLFLDKDGKEAFQGLAIRAGSFRNNLYFLTGFLFATFLILSLSLYVRNRMDFLLYRLIGHSRRLLCQSTCLLFAFSSLFGLILGYLFGFAGVAIMESIMVSGTLFSYSGVFVFTPVSFLLPLAAIVLANLVHILMVTHLLAPKDISKRLSEVNKL